MKIRCVLCVILTNFANLQGCDFVGWIARNIPYIVDKKKINNGLARSLVTEDDKLIKYYLRLGADPDAQINYKQLTSDIINDLFIQRAAFFEIQYNSEKKRTYNIAKALNRYMQHTQQPMMTNREIGRLLNVDFIEE